MLGKRTLIYLICLGGLLIGAVLGWTNIMRKLAEAEAKEIELAETDLLKSILERFELKTSGALGGVSRIELNAVKLRGDSDFHEISGHRGSWAAERKRSGLVDYDLVVLDYGKILTVEKLLGEFSRIEMSSRRELWGNVIDGRDQFGVLLMRLARGDEQSRKMIYPFLLEGVISLGVNEEKVNPGFKLLMIRELEKAAPSRKLELLRTHFEIRAMGEHVSDLQEGVDYENRLGLIETANFELYLTKDQAEKLVGCGSKIELSGVPEENRAWVKVAGLKSRWSYMSLERGRKGSGIVDSWRTLAAWTVVALITFIVLIVLMAWQAIRVARLRLSLAGAVAHELRTPLTGQRVILESLERKKEYDADYVGMALRENKRLSSMSDEFLTYSRLERGVMELQLELISLSEVVGSVVGDFLAQHEGGELNFDHDGVVSCWADSAAVSTIVRNLLENAWKYSEEPRKVEVRVFEGGFLVRDEGVGLSAKEQKRIFGQFYRVEQKLSRSQDGLGIGLSIVKRLVDAMEGRIEVESEKGRGSTFTVFLKKGGVA